MQPISKQINQSYRSYQSPVLISVVRLLHNSFNCISKYNPQYFNRLILPTIFACFISTAAIASERQLIAVTEIVEHQSLEKAWNGIVDVLKENGYNDGDNIEILHKNAQGNIATSQSIAKQFGSMAPTAIVAISTPSAQTIVASIKDTEIPMIFSSVADPVAAGLVKTLDQPTLNVTGAIDFPPTELTLPLMRAVLPKLKKVGFLYNSGEANSVKTINIIKGHLEEGGVSYVESTIQNSSQFSQGFRNLIGKVDAIYIPSDNTVFAAMPTLVKMSRKEKIPVFSSDPDSVNQGVLACAGYSQYAVGRVAGQKLVEILQGNKEVLISKPEKADIVFSKDTAEILEITVPSEVAGLQTSIDEGRVK